MVKLMSYYDPNYWRQVLRYYPYLQPSTQTVMPADPLEQLGLGKKEAIALVNCLYCGDLVPTTIRFCPRCGWPRAV